MAAMQSIAEWLEKLGNAELCWQGTRGSPPQAQCQRPRVGGRAAPVAQPEARLCSYRIEQLYPGPYLELFARSTLPGWVCHGHQVGLLDRGPVKTRRQPSSLVGVF